MKRIGIVGANGQVGTEVCLLLSLMEDVEVIPICRTEIASSFLRSCGLKPRHGSVSKPEEAERLLAGCDAVADFSLPTGSPSEVRSLMRATIGNVTRYAPPKASFIYLSSITAFGVPDFHSPLRQYLFSRNTYGASKRFGEQTAFLSSRRSQRDCFVLRVGVVHGELQGVSRKTVEDMRRNSYRTAFLPNAPSYTVFAFSIAEALVAIANGREQPGLYTMLSNPGWSWKDLHDWYARKAGLDIDICLLPPDHAPRSLSERTKSVLKNLLNPAIRLMIANKDIIAGHFSASMPALENTLRAGYQCRNAAAEIAAGQMATQYRPYGNNHTDFPGQRLQTISDSRVTMERYTSQLPGIVQAARNRETAHFSKAPVQLSMANAGKR